MIRDWAKAPPVDQFHANDAELHVWLPTLECAVVWNNWSDENRLAGHLHGMASQVWNLLSIDDKQTHAAAVEALCACLDPGRQALAVQDLQYTWPLWVYTFKYIKLLICGIVYWIISAGHNFLCFFLFDWVEKSELTIVNVIMYYYIFYGIVRLASKNLACWLLY